MGIIKKWRQKRRDEQNPVAIDDQNPEAVFLWQIGRLRFARNAMMLDIAFHRRLFPQESLGSSLSRLWWRCGDDLTAGDIVQINPEFSPNIGGCFLIVEDCGAERVFGYILAPARDGRVGIDMAVPIKDVRRLGRPFWRSDRVRLLGGKQ